MTKPIDSNGPSRGLPERLTDPTFLNYYTPPEEVAKRNTEEFRQAETRRSEELKARRAARKARLAEKKHQERNIPPTP